MARFLVVDDDHPTVVAVTRLLTDDGHDVSPFTAGEEAVEALAREPFDAVMTDLEMPSVDGHAVVRATRRHLPQACLIVATAKATEHEEALTQAGACIVTDKPLDYEGVTKAIAECHARGGRGLQGGCYMKSKIEPGDIA